MHCVYGVFTGTGLIRRKMRVVVTPGDVKPGFHCSLQSLDATATKEWSGAALVSKASAASKFLASRNL